MSNPNKLVIDTGELRIEIFDKNDVSRGEIVFNPKDVNFATRFYGLIKQFESTLKDYKAKGKALGMDKVIKPEDLTEDIVNQRLALLKETCDYIRERIDFLFGAGTSQVAFGDTLSLEAFGQFFEGMTPYVRNARAAKVSAYTGTSRKTGGKKLME